MGLYLSGHVGPYIKLKTKKNTSNVKLETCDNDICNLHMEPAKSKYCPSCGDPIIEKLVPADDEISYHDWLYNLEELDNSEYEDVFQVATSSEICDEGEQILVSNSRGGSHGGNLTHGGIVDITDIDIQEDLKKFNSKFGELIEKLRQYFGEDAIQVRWGTVLWYN